MQNTHLDRTELSLCVSLIENGVNPDALAVRSLFRFLLSIAWLMDGFLVDRYQGFEEGGACSGAC